MKGKKLISVLLASLMIFSLLLSSCGTTATTTTATTTTAKTTVTSSTAQASGGTTQSTTGTKAIPRFKIGYVYAPPADSLSRAFYATLDYMGKEFNCQMLYVNLTSYGVEDWVAAYENLVQQGANALILVRPTPALIQMLNQKGVYYTGLSSAITDQIRAVANGSKYFCGWFDQASSGADYDVAYKLMQTMYAKGVRKVAYVAAAAGNTAGDLRIKGFEDAVKEHSDMKIVATFRGNDMALGLTDILATYGSQIDGLISASGGSTVASAIISAGYSKTIKFACVDTSDADIQTFTNGMQVAVGAGNANMLMFGFVAVYNALSGSDRLFAQQLDKGIPIPKSFVITNLDEYNAYIKYFLKDHYAFTGDELKKLSSVYTPNTTIAEKEALWSKYCSFEFFNPAATAKRFGG